MQHDPSPQPPNATAAALLGLLHQGERTGWDLVAAVEQRLGGFWSVTRSQVYRELKTMTASGLIEPGETGARDAQPYRITPTGRAAFAEWIARDPAPQTVRMPLLLTIAFSEHLGSAHLSGILDRQRSEHRDRLAQHLATRRAFETEEGVDATRLATNDFGVRYERAVLAWLDEVESLLGRDDD